jgi:hypothetical protein
MPDFGSPVATGVNVNPNQAIQTLSGLLSLKQQRQALDTGALQQQGVAAQAAQSQQQNQELQALSQFTRNAVTDPTFRKEDGSLDMEKFQKGAAAVAPVYGHAYIGQATSNANAMIDNRKALLGLSNEQRRTLGGYFGAVAAKPNANRDDFLDAAERARTVSQDPAYQRSIDRMLMSAPNVRDLSTAQASQAVRQWARGISMETGAPVSAESGPAVQMIQGPSGLVPTNVNPQSPGGVGAVGPAQAQGIAPQIVTSPVTGGQGVVGGSGGLNPRPIGGAGVPSGPSPWQPYPGQQGDIKTYQTEVQGTRQAADAAPTARNINAQILRLADNAKTGPGTEVWQHAVGALAAPFGLSPTASYQELGKFLEKNAIQNMTSMGGPPSDARLSAAAAANGSTHFSPEALKAVTKFNDATNTALMQYRQGMDRAVGMGQNVDYTRLPAFKAAWAKNFDVDVFRVENAIRDGDKAELTKIRSELGPKRLQELGQKSANLRLLEQGQIPNG